MPRVRQRDIEKAMHVAAKAGLNPTRINFAPDGSFSLCFGEPKDDPEEVLDRELKEWEAKHAAV